MGKAMKPVSDTGSSGPVVAAGEAATKAGLCLACDKGQNRRCARLPTCPYKRPYVTKARGLKSAAAAAALAAAQIAANADKVRAPSGNAKAKQAAAKANQLEYHPAARANSRTLSSAAKQKQAHTKSRNIRSHAHMDPPRGGGGSGSECMLLSSANAFPSPWGNNATSSSSSQADAAVLGASVSGDSVLSGTDGRRMLRRLEMPGSWNFLSTGAADFLLDDPTAIRDTNNGEGGSTAFSDEFSIGEEDDGPQHTVSGASSNSFDGQPNNTGQLREPKTANGRRLRASADDNKRSGKRYKRESPPSEGHGGDEAAAGADGGEGGAARSSAYRGVTKHRWTGRFEAHLWDSNCMRSGSDNKGRAKGRQVYLGGYESEVHAARAFDRAAIKYWGLQTALNFPVDDYAAEMPMIHGLTTEELVAHLRRMSSGVARGTSTFRGVTRHHEHGRWEARIGRVAGNKYLYLGTFTSEEDAAKAYDIAALKHRGVKAVTNFNVCYYDVEAISLGTLTPEMAPSTVLTAPGSLAAGRPPRARAARQVKAEESEEEDSEEEDDTPIAPVVTARGRQTKPTSKVGALIAAKEAKMMSPTKKRAAAVTIMTAPMPKPEPVAPMQGSVEEAMRREAAAAAADGGGFVGAAHAGGFAHARGLSFDAGQAAAAYELPPVGVQQQVEHQGSSFSIKGMFNSASMERLPTMDDICGQFLSDSCQMDTMNDMESGGGANDMWTCACLV